MHQNERVREPQHLYTNTMLKLSTGDNARELRKESKDKKSSDDSNILIT